jgi:hypothetical protein
MVFVAELLLFLNTGPLNAALVGCVPSQMRGAAFAANILCIHAFGDALSSTLLGVISDAATPVLGSEAAGLSVWRSRRRGSRWRSAGSCCSAARAGSPGSRTG